MKHARVALGLLVAGLLPTLTGGCSESELDRELRVVIDRLELTPLQRPPTAPPELVRLGEALFFDKELSGNRDVACATCHHPFEHSGDGLALPIGTGGRALGAARELGEARDFVPRNSPDLFNRGAGGWAALFWDGRVERTATGLASPAGTALPAGLDGLLAAQAMFPVTSRDEMRGAPGDRDVRGHANELASISDDDFGAIWAALTRRLRANPAYVELFAAAYPTVPTESLGFQHAANAIAAYEAQAFWFADTPWDAYVAGDDGALSREAKRGALLFFGEGRCFLCHAGPLFTDQRYHNVGVPQLGPGKGLSAPEDLGRALVTGREGDRCAFRTPPLRNVTLTGPWMHDGAYAELEEAVRHMADPRRALEAYETSGLPAPLRATVASRAERDAILRTLDPVVSDGCGLSDQDVRDLLTFLGALTDPAARDLTHLVPAAVPSGLPVDGVGAAGGEPGGTR